MQPLIRELRERQQQDRRQVQTPYQQFVGRLTALPDEIPVAQQTPAQEEHVGCKERKRREKEAKREYQEMGAQGRLLSLEEVRGLKMFQDRETLKQWGDTRTKHTNLPMRESMRMAANGDYSDFENLDGVMRSLLAKQALDKLDMDFGITEASDAQEICDRLRSSASGVSALLNPTLRLGLSLAQNDPNIEPQRKEFYRELDEAMTTAVMEETLTHRADPQIVRHDLAAKHPEWMQEDLESFTQGTIEQYEAQQIQIAKRLLLMQLSNFQRVDRVDGQDRSSPWDKSMAVALSHCSRVVLTFPQVEHTERMQNGPQAHQEMWDRIFNLSTGMGPLNKAQDNPRGSSTHSLARRKVSEGPGHSREKKVLFNFVGQRGMNCAIGGLGNVGVSGRMISSDGSCGHFYSMYQKADESHYGAMLMGMESDAYGVKNQLGHTHDLHATGEKASSFGGQRTDEVGKKYGGRQCDLTARNAMEIARWMRMLEDAMTSWQSMPGGMETPQAKEAMKLLAGKKLDADGLMHLAQIMTEAALPHEV